MNNLFLGVFFLILAFTNAQKFLTSVQAGHLPIALYFAYQDQETSQQQENLLQIVPANEIANELNHGDTSFVIRSSDLQTRFRVEVMNPNEDPERPFGLIITNLATFDRGGAKAIELKHGDSGYIWIEPTHNVAHVTGTNVPFEVRDFDKNLVASILIHEYNEEL